MTDTLDISIAAAKEDPLVAKQLFEFARYGCRSEESERGVRDTFAELAIPLGFLSQKEKPRPLQDLE